MRTKRHELVTALVHSTGMLSRAMHGGIQAEREVADLARRGEEDRLNLRHDLDRETRRRERAEERVGELETCYKNASETIERQAKELKANYAGCTAEIDAICALADGEDPGPDAQVAIPGGKVKALRQERDDLATRNAALEEQVRELSGLCRAGEAPAHLTAGQLAERCERQSRYIAEYSGIVERLRTGAREALEALLDGSGLQAVRQAVSALNFALEAAAGTDATEHAGTLADALNTCRERKHEIEELERTCADLSKARDGHQAAAMRSAERMAAAAVELQKVRPALRPGHGTIQDGVDRALELLTGEQDPSPTPLLDATRRAASHPASDAERREHQRTASVRNAQTMRELTTGCPTRTREEP